MPSKKTTVKTNAKVTKTDRTIFVVLEKDHYDDSYNTYVADTEKEAKEGGDFYIKVVVPNFEKKTAVLLGEVRTTA